MTHTEKYAGVRHHYSRGVREGNWVEEGFGELLREERQLHPAHLLGETTSGMAYGGASLALHSGARSGASGGSRGHSGVSADLLFPHGPEMEWTRRRLAPSTGTELASPHHTDALRTGQLLILAQQPANAPTAAHLRSSLRDRTLSPDAVPTTAYSKAPNAKHPGSGSGSGFASASGPVQAQHREYDSSAYLSTTYREVHGSMQTNSGTTTAPSRLPPIHPHQQQNQPSQKISVAHFDKSHLKTDLRGPYPLRVSPLRDLNDSK
eukprot:TRINITY_DN222_c0_g1_i14.p1 TRINITY_DN222_c0_g1~~TRINITY_DN222_c0_g1_i14.p1  ORF type:complete len:264 (-),score=30.95 TRINITY_DN222_c0_g1_i14:173-964(-)